jgi:hypothetical protein
MREKKLNQASRFVGEVDMAMGALYRARQIVRECELAGLSFEDADFEGTALSHLNAATLTTAMQAITTLVETCEPKDGGVCALQAVRP